jgi:DNA-binding response OmpR family regulator
MKVLIVDDEPNIVMSLDFLMRKAKHEVFVARNGTEALELAARERPDLVILDIMMPDIDGYEVCRRLKAQEATRHAKIIFLSAKSREADVQKGLALGADSYLTKPFSTKELMRQVEALIQG